MLLNAFYNKRENEWNCENVVVYTDYCVLKLDSKVGKNIGYKGQAQSSVGFWSTLDVRN